MKYNIIVCRIDGKNYEAPVDNETKKKVICGDLSGAGKFLDGKYDRNFDRVAKADGKWEIKNGVTKLLTTEDFFQTIDESITSAVPFMGKESISDTQALRTLSLNAIYGSEKRSVRLEGLIDPELKEKMEFSKFREKSLTSGGAAEAIKAARGRAMGEFAYTSFDIKIKGRCYVAKKEKNNLAYLAKWCNDVENPYRTLILMVDMPQVQDYNDGSEGRGTSFGKWLIGDASDKQAGVKEENYKKGNDSSIPYRTIILTYAYVVHYEESYDDQAGTGTYTLVVRQHKEALRDVIVKERKKVGNEKEGSLGPKITEAAKMKSANMALERNIVDNSISTGQNIVSSASTAVGFTNFGKPKNIYKQK